jgi:hypothetical protein
MEKPQSFQTHSKWNPKAQRTQVLERRKIRKGQRKQRPPNMESKSLIRERKT